MELPEKVLNERARIKCERERVQAQLDRLFERRRQLDDRHMELDDELHAWLREVEDVRLAAEKARVPTTTEAAAPSSVSVHLHADSAKCAPGVKGVPGVFR